jgi:hypothetical protein
MTGEPLAFSRTKAAAVFAVLLGLWLSLASPATAGPLGSLRDGLFGRHPSDGRDIAAPMVARYVTEDGDVFTFDRSQAKALLKFDGSFEVWALQPQPAPRGDTIYKNDLGEPVLRATRLGGVTVFTDQRPGGAAAALAGIAPPLKLAIMGPQVLLERLAQASARASRAARRLIQFDAGRPGQEATPISAPLIADAAMVTSEAVVRMSKRSDARKVLDHIARVQLVEGSHASVQLDGAGVLEVTVAPPQGLAGRPSSDRIVQVAQSFRQ